MRSKKPGKREKTAPENISGDSFGADCSGRISVLYLDFGSDSVIAGSIYIRINGLRVRKSENIGGIYHGEKIDRTGILHIGDG